MREEERAKTIRSHESTSWRPGFINEGSKFGEEEGEEGLDEPKWTTTTYI
jgi:hypothetical protein